MEEKKAHIRTHSDTRSLIYILLFVMRCGSGMIEVDSFFLLLFHIEHKTFTMKLSLVITCESDCC